MTDDIESVDYPLDNRLRNANGFKFMDLCANKDYEGAEVFIQETYKDEEFKLLLRKLIKSVQKIDNES